MASTAYPSLGADNDKPSRAGNSPSQESSSSARFTPDSDSEDDDEVGHEDLGHLEAGKGYEMRSLSKESGRHAATGAEDDADKEEDALLNEDEDASRSRRRRRRKSVQSFELYTPDEEKAVRQKLDTHLVLCVALLYMLSFLDRSNM